MTHLNDRARSGADAPAAAARPLFAQIKARLRQDILEKRLPAGQKLPSEAQMQQAFGAVDLPELGAAQLGSAGLDESDWENLRFTMAAGFTAREVSHDLSGLWAQLREDTAHQAENPARADYALIVWRRAMQPHFRLLELAESSALSHLINGATLGQTGTALEQVGSDPAQLGQWLATWLGEGLFAAYSIAA